MFPFGKKKKNAIPGTACAPATGESMPLEQMPDKVFAEGVLGNGICVLPENGKIYSPVAGVVFDVFDTGHAYSLEAADGAEIMIHIGVDTVRLAKGAFKPKVKQGQRVAAGELLCNADLDAIAQAGYAQHVAMVVTNGDQFEITEKHYGHCEGAHTPAFAYKKRVHE